MKKSLIFVGILAIGFANAQEGNVGINTDQPKATLDIQPNATNLAGTTNQGILAPRLSKTRVANIETPVQGTLVYVLDENSTEYPNSLISAYTGTDAKVAKITEKGYYFYNGTEWVKAGVANNEQEWKFIGTSTNSNNFILNDVALTKGITTQGNTVIARTARKDTTNEIGGALELNSYDSNEHLTKAVLTDGGLYLTRTDNAPSNHILGYVDFQKKHGEPSVRLSGIDYKNTKSTTDDELGLSFDVTSPLLENGNTPFQFRISQGDTYRQNTLFSEKISKTGYFLNLANVDGSDQVGNHRYHRITKVISNGNDLRNGIMMDWSINRFLDTSSTWHGTTTRLQKSVDVTKMGFIDFGINNDTQNEATTNNGLGFGYNDTVHAVIRENGNMGIGTTKPTEKLEVDGKIKASSLAQTGAGDRVVYADENGVLKTGVSAAANVKLATANNVECTEANTGTMNFGSVTINGKATEAFGFCMKNSTGEYKWYYIYGGAGITTGSGAFGSGL